MARSEAEMSAEDLNEEISPEELDALQPGQYFLIDIRSEEEYEHGFIPGCVLLSPEQVREMAQAAISIADGKDVPSSSSHAKAADVENGIDIPRSCADVSSGGSDLSSSGSGVNASSIPGRARTQDSSPAFARAGRIIIYCRYGGVSRELSDELRAMGFPAQNLTGGYGAWALHAIREQAKSEEKRRQIELGIQKGAFHRDLLNPFARAILKYQMIQNGDHIAVCISGGKDSMLMAKLFQEFQRHGQFRFDLTFLCMDPGYSEANRKIIESNASLLGIPLEFFETNIFDTVYNIPSSPCYLCARMRRGWLYKEAKARGCNKIALGHHYDDVIETVFMGMLYSGQWAAMMPKLRSTNFEDMQLIRPMYFIREEDIKRWRDVNHLHFIQCACHFTDTCTTCAVTGGIGGNGNCNNSGSADLSANTLDIAPQWASAGSEHSGHKRTETKQLIAMLKKTNPDIETNLFHATENVHIDKLLGWTKDGARHSFLEDF